MIINNNRTNDENITVTDTTSSNKSDSKSKSDSNKNVYLVGKDITVKVTGFKEYGVFCDCGEDEENKYSGLIHISRITPKYVRNTSDYFVIGDQITAKIIEIHKDSSASWDSSNSSNPKKTVKLSLSTKENNNLEQKKHDFNETKKGFRGLENKLDSWVKEDSNK